MEQKSISKQIIELIASKLESTGSGRSVAKKTKLSNTSIGNYVAGASMKLDTMEKILEAFPELRAPIAEILLGEPIKKGTEATNSDEAPVDQEKLKAQMEESIQYLRAENTKLLNIVELALKRGGTDGT